MNNFQVAYWRLTAWYLLVIMMISLFFSLTVYRVTTAELGAGVRRQSAAFRALPSDLDLPRQQFETILEQQVEASRHHIALNLFYFNLIILGLAGIASYNFAKYTLRPIEESHEAQSRFTADASHELRTPLAAMKTGIEVTLRDAKLSVGDAKAQLKSNLEEIDRLEALSRGLLSLANYEHAENSVVFKEVPIREVVETAQKSVAKLAKERNITIEIELSDTVIQAEVDSLTELFVILFENAIKYSPVGKNVTIGSKVTPGSITIAVADEGMGIGEADIPHLFDRFYRADLSRSSQKVEGYGLGLSIAKAIVDMHKGKIWVRSQLESGSTFYITLPIKQK